jgi:hypothetical protein
MTRFLILSHKTNTFEGIVSLRSFCDDLFLVNAVDQMEEAIEDAWSAQNYFSRIVIDLDAVNEEDQPDVYEYALTKAFVADVFFLSNDFPYWHFDLEWYSLREHKLKKEHFWELLKKKQFLQRYPLIHNEREYMTEDPESYENTRIDWADLDPFTHSTMLCTREQLVSFWKPSRTDGVASIPIEGVEQGLEFQWVHLNNPNRPVWDARLEEGWLYRFRLNGKVLTMKESLRETYRSNVYYHSLETPELEDPWAAGIVSLTDAKISVKKDGAKIIIKAEEDKSAAAYDFVLNTKVMEIVIDSDTSTGSLKNTWSFDNSQ